MNLRFIVCRRRLMILAAFLVVIVLAGWMAINWSKNGVNPSGVEKNPKVESLLLQLVQSSNPEAFAREHGLFFKDGRVRVVIELNDPNYVLPNYYGVEEKRHGSKVQALVKVDRLLELAESPYVRFISSPTPPSEL